MTTQADFVDACACNDVALVQRLLATSGAQVNVPTTRGAWPLIVACKEGCADVVVCLLEHGAKTNVARDRRGRTALVVALQRNNNELVDLLLHGGNAQPNVPWFRHGASYSYPLHVAVLERNRQCVEWLLAKQAAINCENQYGETPLVHAVTNNDWSLVRLLLDHGANADTRTVNLTPLLSHAIRTHRPLCAAQLLLFVKDIDARDAADQTALCAAVRVRSLQMIETLLRRGANPAFAEPLVRALPAGVLVDAFRRLTHTTQ